VERQSARELPARFCRQSLARLAGHETAPPTPWLDSTCYMQVFIFVLLTEKKRNSHFSNWLCQNQLTGFPTVFVIADVAELGCCSSGSNDCPHCRFEQACPATADPFVVWTQCCQCRAVRYVLQDRRIACRRAARQVSCGLIAIY